MSASASGPMKDGKVVDLDALQAPPGSPGSSPQQPLQKNHSINIDALQIPDSLKSVLRELEVSKADGITEETLKEELQMIKAFKSGMAEHSKSGRVTTKELEEHIQLLSRLAKDKSTNAGSLAYDHMPQCIQDVLKEWDSDGSGAVSVTELASASKAFQKIKDESRLMKKMIIGLSVIVFILMIGMFVLSIAAAEIAKESHVKGGIMVDRSGDVVRVGSADFEVCKDGSMAVYGQCAAPGRRLQEDSGTNRSSSLKTVNIKERKALSSSLPDHFFMALDEIAVYSDKGHSLRLEIHGFARVPVLNSRCGNIVHLYTAWNGRISLDSVDLSFDEQLEAAFTNAGFSLIVGGVSGRRLAGGHGVDGFFSAVQGVEEQGWDCQDVPLPSLPESYVQQFTIHRPCAVEGVTGKELDMCDSMFGGVLPGTAKLPRALQLATMSKTERIRAKLSVDVPIDTTLFSAVDVEVMKSSKYELQLSRFANHPGMLKVILFDRSASDDIFFQIIEGHSGEGRFYCNSSGIEETPQKRDEESAKKGVDRKLHFEFMDMVESEGRMLRHFRMMPAEAFLEWMGAKNATDRPKDAYYEYWDDAETLMPVRLLNPDASLVNFKSTSGNPTDADVVAKLAGLGLTLDSAFMTCTAKEQSLEDEDTTAAGFGDMRVPMMLSPMQDLLPEEFAFYAKLNVDTHVEEATGNGWMSMVKRSESDTDPLSSFAKYALASREPWSMPDLCTEVCTKEMMALETEMKGDPDLELCDATTLTPAVRCMMDIAAIKNNKCAKSNFVRTIEDECIGQFNNTNNRRLDEGDAVGDEEWDFSADDEAADGLGSMMYLTRMGRKPRVERPERRELGTTKSNLRQLSDGTMELDLTTLTSEQRAQLAQAIGVQDVSGSQLYFNMSNAAHQQAVATMQAIDAEGAVHTRRLALEPACKGTGVGPGCIFHLGYPWGCDPITDTPECKFGIAAKIQIGGPAHGALTVAGEGCVYEWVWGVPKPFKGELCIDGGITVSWSPACDLPFTLSGYVGLTAKVGLDLVIFSFDLASLRIEVGAEVGNYKYNCDSRRRRRRAWGGRRRGNDENCNTRCDIKVYAKATFQIFIGRFWAIFQYFVKSREFDFILGADIYIWLVVTGYWETVA